MQNISWKHLSQAYCKWRRHHLANSHTKSRLLYCKSFCRSQQWLTVTIGTTRNDLNDRVWPCKILNNRIRTLLFMVFSGNLRLLTVVHERSWSSAMVYDRSSLIAITSSKKIFTFVLRILNFRSDDRSIGE